MALFISTGSGTDFVKSIVLPCAGDASSSQAGDWPRSRHRSIGDLRPDENEHHHHATKVTLAA
jgi:hypothetical protein